MVPNQSQADIPNVSRRDDIPIDSFMPSIIERNDDFVIIIKPCYVRMYGEFDVSKYCVTTEIIGDAGYCGEIGLEVVRNSRQLEMGSSFGLRDEWSCVCRSHKEICVSAIWNKYHFLNVDIIWQCCCKFSI
jgi:hypothetical protein